MQHQMQEGHPDFCSPAVLYVEDSDCLMQPVERLFLKWTSNLPPERVIPLLERAIERMRLELAFREARAGTDSNETIVNGAVAR